MICHKTSIFYFIAKSCILENIKNCKITIVTRFVRILLLTNQYVNANKFNVSMTVNRSLS